MNAFKGLYILFIIFLLACSDDSEVTPQILVCTGPPPNATTTEKRMEFSTPETYACTNILIDASRDGGAWWYPQAEDFNAAAEHQGKRFAELLRQNGFRVDEMPRTKTISDDVLKNYAVIIRTDGTVYGTDEIQAYHKKVSEGVTLLLLADHHKFERTDGLAQSFNVSFTAVVDGKISKLVSNPFTNNTGSLSYMVGSFISNAQQNSDILPVGWLADGSVVMAKYQHEKSEIFLMGDVNTLEFNPEPFVENLTTWIQTRCSNR
jgi:hypothetical protein